MIRLQYLCVGAFVGFGVLLLAGCGMDPVHPDQDVALPAGDGIAGVVLDTLDPINAFYIKSPDNSKAPTIEITHVKVGVTLLPYVVPAGRYCVTRYSFSTYDITQSHPKDGVCFDVVAGKIAYSGNLAPRGHGGGVYVDQNYDWRDFEKSLKEQYPKLSTYPVVTP